MVSGPTDDTVVTWGLELRASDTPALVLVQGENRVRTELAHVMGLVAALADATEHLTAMLAAVGVYHA